MTRLVRGPAQAGPAELRQALKDLAQAGRDGSGRTWAVLGAMPGQDRDAHMDLGRFLVRLDLKRLLAVGGPAGAVHAGAVLEGSWGEESMHVPDAGAALGVLSQALLPEDVVLVAGAGLAELPAALLGLGVEPG